MQAFRKWQKHAFCWENKEDRWSQVLGRWPLITVPSWFLSWQAIAKRGPLNSLWMLVFSNTWVSLAQAADLVAVCKQCSCKLLGFSTWLRFYSDNFSPKPKTPDKCIRWIDKLYLKKIRKPGNLLLEEYPQLILFSPQVFPMQMWQKFQGGKAQGKNTHMWRKVFPSHGLFSVCSRRPGELFRDRKNKSWVVGSKYTRDSGVSYNKLRSRVCPVEIMLVTWMKAQGIWSRLW